MNKGSIKEFFSTYKEVNFKKGSVIIREEENPTGIYYLKKGYVRMETTYKSGSEITFNIFKPQTFFPVSWAIAGVDNSYTFSALTNTTLNIASKKDFLVFLKDNPEVLFDFARRQVIGIDGLLTGIKNILRGKARQKICWTILMLSKRFGEVDEENKIKIYLRLTHQDISKLAVLTRETTTTELNKLEKEGVLYFKNGLITVNKVGKLEEEIE